jgi:putative tryptophan/tyrosine transport system substrate-binding protein
MQEARMTHRRIGLLVTLTLAILVALLAAEAQATTRKVPRIGVLIVGSPPSSPDWKQRSVFLQELRTLGWREGETLSVEYRWASPYDRRGTGVFYPADDLAAELVRLPVDVIVAQSGLAIRAVQRATTTIPIVMVTSNDPVAEEFIAGLPRPGGNITGVDASVSAELSAKQLELLKEAVPTVTRIAVLVHPLVPATGQILDDLKIAARALGVRLHVFAVYHPREFKGAFEAARREGAGALLILSALLFDPHHRQLAALAAKHRLPAIAWTPAFVTAGGLMAYGPNWSALWRRAAYYVDRLLKGAKPADLPVERPMTFELVINLKTAKALDLTIPPTLLFQATDVIR